VSEKFTTAELIAYVQRWKNCCASPYIDDESEADVQKCIDIERAVVARLWAADALVAAAKEIEEPEGVIFSDGIGYRTVRIDLFDRFRQAIAASRKVKEEGR